MNDTTLSIDIKVLRPDVVVPTVAHHGDAGFDLATTEPIVLGPGERGIAPTGLAIALPFGMMGLVVPRSGLAAKRGVTVVNSPGIVDAGYRGEVKVALLNTDLKETVTFQPGERVAQLVIQRVPTVALRVVEQLDASERGLGGFGSSGI